MVDRLPKRIDWDIDLLISSSVSWMKSLVAPKDVPHLCYIYRPMMFAYQRQEIFLHQYPAPIRPILKSIVGKIRKWDQKHATEPDLYVGCSKWIANMVRETYGVEAKHLYPPVDTESFIAAGLKTKPGDYYLTALRLESYKRVDILVEACTEMNIPLKILGKGPDADRLQSIAGDTVEFLGFVPDHQLPALVAGAKAFLFPSEEDFGIAPVEALAAGRPVLAYGSAGCLETVTHGETGLHFQTQTTPDVIQCIEEFEQRSWDSEKCVNSAKRFSAQAFREGLQALAEGVINNGSLRSSAAK
ncbi:MAG: glycosyltransferase [Planctomycetota bacterium]|nr:glycosyltransferase [Planctomycetota bacterium]MDP6941975.1 glycosyltransferase [Planctomycetota bacterium]